MEGRVVSHYQIEEKLGGGGMGVVYRARDTRLGRDVALKFLPPHLSTDPDANRRFIREAQAASALDHANLCTIHEIGQTEPASGEPGGQLFIAMAYYRGETLKKKIQDGPLAVDEALDLAVQMACGLCRAHEEGIVHRDIKPANIMVTDHGQVKILDFGLAKAASLDLTRTGQTLGTVAYMSPEQTRGEAVDHRTDIWSFGVVLYEMLTGQRPFRGDYEQAIVYAILNLAPEPLTAVSAKVPEALARIVARCLEKDPARRYPSVNALLADLRRLQGPPSSGARSGAASGPKGNVSQAARVRRRALIIPGIITLAACAFLAWWQWGRAPGMPEARHLAVLPFNVIGSAGEAEVFSDGLVETLASKLTQLEQFQGKLWVVPASEVSESMRPSEARERFGVTMVVTGSIQMEGKRVRLTLNLIDTGTRRQIDSRQVDHRGTSALALQDETILMLARMLEVELQPEARQVLTAGGTSQPQANEFYLRGRGYLRSQQALRDVDQAIEQFRAAIEADARFALAYAGLGEAYWRKYELTANVLWAEEALQHSEQALQLNDQLAVVYVTLGLIYSGRQAYEEALEAYRKALEIEPGNAEAHRRRAIVYRRQGRFDAAEADYQKAIALKPDYWRGYNSLGVFYYGNGDHERAIAQYRKGLALAPANQTLLNNLGAAYWELHRLSDAIDTFKRLLTVEPENAMAKANLATAYFYRGDFAEAARLYEEELSLRPYDFAVQGYLADTYHWLPGRQGQAQQAYRKAIALAKEHLTVRGRDPEVLASLAGYYARLGVQDSARVFLEQVEAALRPEQADAISAFVIGEIYEALGDRDRALVWMTSALRRGYGRIQGQYSPWLADLRSDSTFQHVLAETRPEADQ